jgi:hypothetical protein
MRDPDVALDGFLWNDSGRWFLMRAMLGDRLHVPDVSGLDTLAAALAYARAGFYVGPVAAGTKDPRTSLGKDWPRRTSREPKVLVSWFAGTDRGVFLHCGRSGAVVFDVDAPEHLHPILARAITEVDPPWQSTRPDQPGRRHHLFAQPEDRMLGNGLGKLGSGWGEIRGKNGLIVVAPTVHAEGGRYEWGRTGALPRPPGYLLHELPDALDAADAATDEQVRCFLAAHTGTGRRELLEVHLRAWTRKVERASHATTASPGTWPGR